MRPTLNYKREKFGMQAVFICSLLLLAAQPFALAQDCHGGPRLQASRTICMAPTAAARTA